MFWWSNGDYCTLCFSIVSTTCLEKKYNRTRRPTASCIPLYQSSHPTFDSTMEPQNWSTLLPTSFKHDLHTFLRSLAQFPENQQSCLKKKQSSLIRRPRQCPSSPKPSNVRAWFIALVRLVWILRRISWLRGMLGLVLCVLLLLTLNFVNALTLQRRKHSPTSAPYSKLQALASTM